MTHNTTEYSYWDVTYIPPDREHKEPGVIGTAIAVYALNQYDAAKHAACIVSYLSGYPVPEVKILDVKTGTAPGPYVDPPICEKE